MSKTKKHPQSKRLHYLFPVVVGLILLALLAGALPWPTILASTSLAGEVSVKQAYEMRESGTFVLDVREPDEWSQFHVPGATLIPLGELESRLTEVPAEVSILVVCRSGNRSKAGRDILLNAGFEKVTSMAGGMNAWRAAGYPTASGP